MKKILSLLLVALMIVGMLPLNAIHAHAAEATETLSIFANKGTLASNKSSISWTSGDITFTNNKASNSNAIRTDDADHYRIYKNSSVVISSAAGKISKIVVTCTSNAYAKTLQGGVGNEASISGSVVTITLAAPANSYTITVTSDQYRVKTVVVTYDATDSGTTCEHTDTVAIGVAKDATCTETGMTAGEKCADCGEVITAQKETPIIPHNYIDGVCSCGAEEPKIYKANSIKVGDKVVIVCETKSMELNGFSGTSYATGAAYTGTPVGTYTWTVEAGSVDGTYSFVKDGNYLAWSSSNSAKTTTTKDANSSWKVSFESGNANILNAKDNTRKLQWNASSPRFACYTTAQTAIQIYTFGEKTEECQHTNVITDAAVEPTCTETGLTEGSHCADCPVILVTQQTVPATGHSFTDGVCACGASVVIPEFPESGSYKLVTDIAEIQAGGKFVIVAPVTADGVTTYNAMAVTTSGKADPVAVTVIDGAVSADGNTPVWTVGKFTEDGNTYIILTDGTKYLGYGSSTNFASDDAPYAWVVAESAEGAFSVTSNEVSDRAVYYSIENTKFGAYSTTNAKNEKFVSGLSFYKLTASEGGSETPDPSEPSEPSEPETPVDPPVTETPDTPTEAPTGYVKVTEDPEDWTGTYLIVYEGEDGKAYIFNSTDAVNGYLSGTISDNVIACSTEVDAEAVIIEQMNGGYTIKTKNGYIYGTSGSNKLNFNTSTQQLNTIELAEDGVLITSNTSVLRFNSAKDQLRFRYYNSENYTGQKAIWLYKLSSEATPDTPDTPDCEHTNTTEVSVPATCYTAGSVTITCDNCNEVVGTETIPAGHTFVEGVCSGCNLVEAPVAGTAYKFGMVQGKLNNKIYYINGAMDGYYMGTVEVDANGVSVYLEQTEGGYYFYTYVDGAKKYINMVVDGTYVNGAYEDTASTVYTYNAEKYTIVADVNGEAYWFGTRNDKTYTTMGPVKVSYNGFYGQFYAISNKVTAAQGATQLQAEVETLYNGTELPATVMVGETVMNVVWSIEASDANAAKIEDGKLVLAPQAAAATYTLTATVKNGETDTATATWAGTVVPASAALENGTYVFWINDLAITNVFADTTKNYGDLTSTAGIALTDGKLTGHANANIFTLTANGDGTYTIQANGGNYLYSDMSHASSRYFNLAAEKPASGADWTIVASGEGYYIYNVDRAGAIGLYATNNTFSLYTDAAKHSVLNVTAVAACAHSNKTTSEVPADCIHAGTRTETCGDCGMVVGEEVIKPTGHSYVEGICSVCNGKDPYVFGIKYYIAAKRSEGNYMYMTSDLGTASTLRYQQLDSGLTVAPVNIEPDAAQAGCVFILMPNEDGTYYILAYGVEGDNYLGWTSGNSGILVSEAEALKVTLTEQADGTYIISFGEGDSKRNLALNNNADYKYFAWYTSKQCNDLSLIPVEETKEQVNQYGVVLNDGFLMKFNVSLTANAQIAITANGETVTYSAGQLSAVVNGTYDVYVELAAAQMADVVTVKFITDGVAGETKTYTIKEYAETILAGDYSDVTKQLVTDMLAYGAAAQTYFEYNDKNLVSDGTGAGTETPKADKEMTVIDNGEGVRFYGASLVFENKIALRFYFQVGKDVNFAISEKYAVSEKNELYCVEIADILPQDLNKEFTVTVTDGPIVTYSPMNYLVRMNEKGGESLQALVVALYNYHLAAVAYAQPAAQ